MMPTTAKACGQYINSILAVRDAVSRGFDEALLLDVDGNIAEGSGENLFVVRDGEVLTNDERDSILLGITRDAVIQIARDLGHKVTVGPISLDDLLKPTKHSSQERPQKLPRFAKLTGLSLTMDDVAP